MQRRRFIQNTALLGGMTLVVPSTIIANTSEEEFPIVRVSKRNASSKANLLKMLLRNFKKMLMIKNLVGYSIIVFLIL